MRFTHVSRRRWLALAMGPLLVVSAGVASFAVETIGLTPITPVAQTVAPGGTAIYRITLTNNGSATISNPIVLTRSGTSAGFTAVTTDSAGNPIFTVALSGNGTTEVDVRVTALPGTLFPSVDNTTLTATRSDNGVTNSITVTTSVAQGAGIGLTKSADDITPDVGQVVTFTIAYSNPNAFDVPGFQVTDTVNSSLAITNTGGAAQTGNTLVWTVGLVTASGQPGSSGTVTFQASVLPVPNGTTITNLATGGATSVASSTSNTETLTVNAPTLSLTKSVVAGAPRPGGSLTYQIDYANTGSEALSGFVITDAIDGRLTVTNTGGGVLTGATPSGGTITWTIGALAIGGSGSVQFTADVAVLADGTVISNQATGTGNEIIAVQSNISSVTISGSADLVITKSASPDPVTAGTNVTYTVTVHNNGPDPSAGFTVTDTLPAGTTFVSASSPAGTCTSAITCTMGPLANGADAVITVVATVGSGFSSATLTNAAGISGVMTADPDLTNNSTSVTSGVITSADLGLVKSAPAGAVAGRKIAYTLTATNSGPSDNTGYTIVDALPLGVLFDSASPGCSGTGTVTCTSAGLAAGATQVFTVTVTVDASVASGTVITNSATIASTSTNDPNAGNDVSSAPTTISLESDLSVTKTADKVTADAGSNIVYTVTVTNNGPSGNPAFTLTDPIPAGTTFVSAPGCAVVGADVICTGSLASGASSVFTITVRVLSAASAGSTISNTATATSPTADSNNANNSATAAVGISTSADLRISKTDNPDPVDAGANLTYTLTIVNNGPSDNAGFTVSDPLPAGSTFVSASVDCVHTGGSPGTVTCTNTGLANGATSTYLITISLPASMTPGTVLSNTASITTNATADPDGTNNSSTTTTTVQGEANLSITKTDSPDPVTAGTNLTYTITVTNLGPSDNSGFAVTDPVPAKTAFVSASGACSLSGTTVTCAAPGGLAVGASATFTVIVHVDSSATTSDLINNTATIAAPTPADPDLTNNAASAQTSVAESTEITVSKTDNVASVVAGDGIVHTYVLTATNTGPSDALGVTISDSFPAGFSRGALPAACTPTTGQNFTCNLGTVTGGGGTQSVSVTYTVPSSTTASPQTNTISLTSVHPLDSSSGNTATDDTAVSTSADLSIVKLATPNPAEPTKNVTYTVVVTNDGPSDNRGFSVQDNIPAGTTFVATLSPDCSINGQVLSCSSPGLVKGDSIAYVFVVTVDAGATDGSTIVNTARIVNSQPNDPNAVNDSSTAVTTVTAPRLDLVKSAVPVSGSAVGPGQKITYTITYTNSGSATATAFVVSDTVSALLGDVQPSAGGTLDAVTRVITWQIGTVAPRTAGSVSFTGVVASSATTKTITNVATGIADQLVTRVSSNQVQHTLVPPDVLITKTSDRRQDSEVRPGDSITYQLTVTNRGRVDAFGVVVTDTPPASLGYSQSSTTIGGTPLADQNGTSPLFGTGVSLSTLSPRQTVTISFVMKVLNTATAGSLIENAAFVRWNSASQMSADFFRLRVPRPTSGPTLRQTILVQGPTGTTMFVTVFNKVLAKIANRASAVIPLLPVTGVNALLLLIFALSAIGLGISLSERRATRKRGES